MINFRIGAIKQILLMFRISFLYIGIYVYYFYIKNEIQDRSFIFIFGFIFIIDTLPAIILHIQYLVNEIGVKIAISQENKILLYTKSGTTTLLKFEDIIKFESFKCYAGGAGWNSWAEYEFYRITFSESKKIVITNFRVPNIENIIKNINDIKIEEKFRVLSLLPL